MDNTTVKANVPDRSRKADGTAGGPPSLGKNVVSGKSPGQYGTQTGVKRDSTVSSNAVNNKNDGTYGTMSAKRNMNWPKDNTT